jgi:hypothetical protein
MLILVILVNDILMEINQVNNQTEYFTHNNYFRPYKVVIINNIQVNVYKSSNEDDEDYNKLVLDICPQQIFVGKSQLNKMTEFSGGHGDQFDGNSILLKVNDTSCIYIGKKIMLFHTINPVVSYHSPVGNNDVPYPYAVDSGNNYYLIIEDVIVKSGSELQNYLDNDETPYEYYYGASLITCDKGRIPNAKPLFTNNFNIDKFYIGKESYTMIYTPTPAGNYDRLTSDLGSHIYIRDHNNKKHEVTKQQYIEIMEDFGNIIGASPMVNSLVLDNIE